MYTYISPTLASCSPLPLSLKNDRHGRGSAPLSEMHRCIRELHIKAINNFPALICMGGMYCAALSEMH